jgi:hypothetical protein
MIGSFMLSERSRSEHPLLCSEGVQEHHYEIELDATPREVWEVFWYRGADKPKPQLVTIEILHPGDESGEGLVRHCTFPVPKVLGSGGVGKSWEWVTQVKPYESWRYDAVGKPLWSRAVGHIVLDDLGNGRTRLHFIETYETFNLAVPKSCTGVPSELLNPRNAWSQGHESFKAEVSKLGTLFVDNFKKYQSEATPEVISAGPDIKKSEPEATPEVKNHQPEATPEVIVAGPECFGLERSARRSAAKAQGPFCAPYLRTLAAGIACKVNRRLCHCDKTAFHILGSSRFSGHISV